MSAHDEPTLAATQTAAEQLRAANHTARHAPRHPRSLYGRLGAIHELLLSLGQAVGDLRVLASSLAVDPPNGLFSDDTAEPRTHLTAVVGRLLDAQRYVLDSREQIDQAWSSASHLGVDPERPR